MPSAVSSTVRIRAVRGVMRRRRVVRCEWGGHAGLEAGPGRTRSQGQMQEGQQQLWHVRERAARVGPQRRQVGVR